MKGFTLALAAAIIERELGVELHKIEYEDGSKYRFNAYYLNGAVYSGQQYIALSIHGTISGGSPDVMDMRSEGMRMRKRFPILLNNNQDINVSTIETPGAQAEVLNAANYIGEHLTTLYKEVKGVLIGAHTWKMSAYGPLIEWNHSWQQPNIKQLLQTVWWIADNK